MRSANLSADQPSRVFSSTVTDPTLEAEKNAILGKISLCFLLSGALGLAYEILWVRRLLLVFGSSVHAVSTVLSVFFGGLALGGWWFGKRVDRSPASGLRGYALLEGGIGLYAFLTPTLFNALERVYIPIYRASGMSSQVLVSAAFLCSAVVLLIPTTLMGATFPMLSRFLIHQGKERGFKIARLYGYNTIGAVLGTLGVYHIGLPMLGLSKSLLCAGVMNIGISLLCLIFDRRLEAFGFHESLRAARAAFNQTTDEASEILTAFPTQQRPSDSLGWLLVAFGISGAAAMSYEVVWTRTLSLILGSSIYAFCIILATFLTGIALGSLLIERYLRQHSATIRQVIGIQWILGIYGLCSIPLFGQLPDAMVRLWTSLGGSFEKMLWVQVILSVSVMVLPTFLMGILFPIVGDLVTKPMIAFGRRLGNAYAINTLGGILGSFLSGFVMIPLLGLPWTIAVTAMANLFAGFLLYVLYVRRVAVGPSLTRRLAASVLGLVIAFIVSARILIPGWQNQVFASGPYLGPEIFHNLSIREATAQTQLLYYRDSLNATVSVHKTQETLFLRVGGKTDASNGPDMSTQILSAHLPLLLHGNAKSALVIGLGSGVTLGHVGRYPVSTIHCAEIDSAVVEAARYFKDYNDHIHDDPRVRIFVADGRNLLLAASGQYDVIISEPSNPWMANLAYLFTQEFYALAKRTLADGGIMCQWLQLYNIFPQDVKLILKTFHRVFPYVSVWSSLPGDLLLIGSQAPHALEFSELTRRMADPRLKESLTAIGITQPEALLELYWMGNREVERVSAGIDWTHQDDQPSIEFTAPRAMYMNRISRLNFAGLEALKGKPQDLAVGYAPNLKDAKFQRALANLWQWRDQPLKAIQALEQAVAVDPSSAKSWLDLGNLYRTQNKILQSEQSYLRAIQADPDDPQPYQKLALLYWQQGKLPQAQSYYEQAASVKIPDRSLAEEIGHYFRNVASVVPSSKTQSLSWAAEYYRCALSQASADNPAILEAYAEVLKEQNLWDEAEKVLTSAAAQFPEQPLFGLRLGELFVEQDKPIEAKAWFERTLKQSPKSAEAYYGLGRVAMHEGNVQEAIRDLRRALTVNPYHRESLEFFEQIQDSAQRNISGHAHRDRASDSAKPPL